MQKVFKWLFLGLLLVILLPLFSAQVGAINPSSPSASSKLLQKKLMTDSKKLAATNAALPTKATRASEFAQNACEAHIKVINLRQRNIIAHAEGVQNRLGKLTTAVQKYYTERLLPQGKVVANYDSLVADISTKQAALTLVLDKVKADASGLTCEKNQAKGQFTTFRTDMQSLLKAFKDYRLSVLNLMQAVKRVAGDSAAKEATKSAETGE